MANKIDTYPYFKRFINPLLSGAFAGLAVDITLYPIDTIKTRLQSVDGFWKSGGFTRIYSGIGSTISASAPGAALFFITYESGKYILGPEGLGFENENNKILTYMISASMGEIVACLIRVPAEVIKQRAQAFNLSSLHVLRQTISQSGWRGLYRGYASTIIREIPFSMIQFSLWEQTKQLWINWQQLSTIEAYQSMICGSISGAIAAFLTTPLDVCKTQIMLQEFSHSRRTNDERKRKSKKKRSMPMRYIRTLKSIYQQNGFKGLWAGAVPRVIWIAIGGAIFLGGYEWIRQTLENIFDHDNNNNLYLQNKSTTKF